MTDCQRIDHTLANDPATLDPTLEAHLASCRRCRSVRERLGAVLSMPRSARVSRARRRWVWIGASATLLFAAIVTPFVLRSLAETSPRSAEIEKPVDSKAEVGGQPSAPGAESRSSEEATTTPAETVVAAPAETVVGDDGRAGRAGQAGQAAPEGSVGEPVQEEAAARSTARAGAASHETASAPRASSSAGASREGAGARDRGDGLDALLSGAVPGGSAANDEPPSTDDRPPETLSRSQVQKSISRVLRDTQACTAAYRVAGVVTVEIEIANDGRVRSAKVTGRFAGTPIGNCIAAAVRRATFPRFSGPPIKIQYPFVVGHGGSPPTGSERQGANRRDETPAGRPSDPGVLKLDTFARRSRQPLAPPTKSALAMYAGLDRSRVRVGGDSMVLQVGLRATDRAPRPDRLNLVLALDVSGSMGDEKLEYTKRAALESIRALDKRDRVAVVAYADKPRIIVPAGPPDPEDAEARFLFLSAGGRTDIGAALIRAYDVASRVHRAGDSTRVLLLSDGQVTSGVSDVETFDANARAAFRAGISTTTIGVGMAHADELLALVARSGNGSYHFLMNPSEIASTMRAEIDSLARAVASAILVRVVLADGVTAQRVLGQPALFHPSVEDPAGNAAEGREESRRWIASAGGSTSGSGLRTTVPHFFASASYVSMIEVEVPPGRGRRSVADVSVRYRDLVVGHHVTHRRTLVIDYTPDPADALRSLDPTVHKNVIAFHMAEALRAAADDVEIGRTDRAALRVREQHRLVLAAARRFEDEVLDRDADILSRYREALADLSDDRARRYVALTFRSSADILVR